MNRTLQLAGEPDQQFQLGEKVVHWTYGPGVIVQMDKKVIGGHSTECYVVRIEEMTLWVPFSRAATGSLRHPTPAERFDELRQILSSPGKPLSDDRLERRNHLVQQLKDGTLEGICHVLRDLSTLKHTGKLNDHDTATFERSLKFLLAEWEIVFSVPANQAEQTVRQLLGENLPQPVPKVRK